MFYRKTDIEILCETLIKLAEKQEHFNLKFGLKEKSPFEQAMRSVMMAIEHGLNLPSRNIGNEIPKDANNTLSNQKFSAKVEEKVAVHKKRVKKVQRFFTGVKPPLQVIHGHASDMPVKEPGIIDSKPQVESVTEAVFGTKEFPSQKETVIHRKIIESSPTPKIPVIKEEVTVDNVDALTESLSGAFEPKMEQPQAFSPLN